MQPTSEQITVCTGNHIGHGEQFWKPLRCISYLLWSLNIHTHIFFNQILDSHGTPPSLVALIIPTPLPTIACFQQRTPCPVAHLSPHTHLLQLIQTLLQLPPICLFTHTSNSPSQTPEVAVSSATSSTALYAPTTHPPTSTTISPVYVVAQKGAWKSCWLYAAHGQDSDSLLELGTSSDWGNCWMRMQPKQ